MNYSRTLTLALLCGALTLSIGVARASRPVAHRHHWTIDIPVAINMPDTARADGSALAAAPAPAPLDGGDDHHYCTSEKEASLGFGAMYTSPSSGTITVSPGGTATYTGGVLGRTDAGCRVSAAEVEINLINDSHREDDDKCSSDDNEYCRSEDDDEHTNDNHTSYTRHGCSVTLSLPSSSTLYRAGGSETMSVTNFTISRTEGYLYIGATLHVGANQRSGSYSGDFTVSVDCE